MENARIVLITAPDEAAGLRIARTLVEERLAACVNVVAHVRSVFRWDGKVQEDAEVLLVGKTTAERAPDLEARVRAIHPYAVPEVLFLSIEGGSAPYLAWLASSCAPTTPPSRL